MDQTEEDVVIACGLYLLCKEETKRKKHRKYWIHDVFRAREEEGEFHTLFGRLKDDPQKFFKYFRMSFPKFEHLLHFLQPLLQKKHTKWRRSITPEERLALTLRFLASGNSQISMSFSYRIAPSTVHSIIVSTCEAIWEKLSPVELPQPAEEAWMKISEEFSLWNFPNCIGAIDGKHVEVQAPQNSGSLFYNYKKTFSVVLLALVDANYKFIVIDVGGYGKSSDGGLFSKSALGSALEANALNIPNVKPLPNYDKSLPLVIVGDEAFPLKKYLLRPYPGGTRVFDESHRIFNYRLSRARRVVENAFGILVQRFRIFYGRIQMNPESVDKVIKASCVLHNYLREDTNSTNFTRFPHIGRRASEEATTIRDLYRDYFVTSGSVPWQLDEIRRGTTIRN